MQKLQVTDYDKIKSYLDVANYEGYNSNFVTMMMWDHEYHVQYEIHDHFLIMLQEYKDILFFAMPFCKKEYCKEAIDYMIQYANEHDFPFLIDGVTKEIKEYIKSIYKDTFIYQSTPDNDDYVYDKELLETLSGKK
ncbi:MAG: phosphatidylglycerol lysyltransferase domain-containing protein, partial [Coprobacillaceae bacterium]